MLSGDANFASNNIAEKFPIILSAPDSVLALVDLFFAPLLFLNLSSFDAFEVALEVM